MPTYFLTPVAKSNKPWAYLAFASASFNVAPDLSASDTAAVLALIALSCASMSLADKESEVAVASMTCALIPNASAKCELAVETLV